MFALLLLKMSLTQHGVLAEHGLGNAKVTLTPGSHHVFILAKQSNIF